MPPASASKTFTFEKIPYSGTFDEDISCWNQSVGIINSPSATNEHGIITGYEDGDPKKAKCIGDTKTGKMTGTWHSGKIYSVMQLEAETSKAEWAKANYKKLTVTMYEGDNKPYQRIEKLINGKGEVVAKDLFDLPAAQTAPTQTPTTPSTPASSSNSSAPTTLPATMPPAENLTDPPPPVTPPQSTLPATPPTVRPSASQPGANSAATRTPTASPVFELMPVPKNAYRPDIIARNNTVALLETKWKEGEAKIDPATGVVTYREKTPGGPHPILIHTDWGKPDEKVWIDTPAGYHDYTWDPMSNKVSSVPSNGFGVSWEKQKNGDLITRHFSNGDEKQPRRILRNGIIVDNPSADANYNELSARLGFLNPQTVPTQAPTPNSMPGAENKIEAQLKQIKPIKTPKNADEKSEGIQQQRIFNNKVEMVQNAIPQEKKLVKVKDESGKETEKYKEVKVKYNEKDQSKKVITITTPGPKSREDYVMTEETTLYPSEKITEYFQAKGPVKDKGLKEVAAGQLEWKKTGNSLDISNDVTLFYYNPLGRGVDSRIKKTLQVNEKGQVQNKKLEHLDTIPDYAKHD